jgi:hypothetical protein
MSKFAIDDGSSGYKDELRELASHGEAQGSGSPKRDFSKVRPLLPSNHPCPYVLFLFFLST